MSNDLYCVGSIEPILGKEFQIIANSPVEGKEYTRFVTLRNIKKDGTLGRIGARFFTDNRVKSVKVYRVRPL